MNVKGVKLCILLKDHEFMVRGKSIQSKNAEYERNIIHNNKSTLVFKYVCIKKSEN
jgi:hypothetical protein